MRAYHVQSTSVDGLTRNKLGVFMKCSLIHELITDCGNNSVVRGGLANTSPRIVRELKFGNSESERGPLPYSFAADTFVRRWIDA